ncbi:MAG: cyclic nucleotide-binding domain-containing protein [Candidatus Sericytochromatia bacterium]|nr:cyclic nucleotide-binding domain-containing protein [Candidatus Sericytochromatia bacterium]
MSVENLSALPFFQGFSPDDLESLSVVMQAKTFSPGETIFAEGVPDDGALFVALKGGIRVSMEGKDHQQFTIGQAREGTVFGDMSFVDGHPRSGTVTAMTPLETMSLSRASFEVLSRTAPSAALKLMRRLAQLISMRLRNADKFVVEAKTMAQATPPEPPRTRVVARGIGEVDETAQPSVFQPVSRLQQVEKRPAGGLTDKDIKERPDVFRRS